MTEIVKHADDCQCAECQKRKKYSSSGGGVSVGKAVGKVVIFPVEAALAMKVLGSRIGELAGMAGDAFASRGGGESSSSGESAGDGELVDEMHMADVLSQEDLLTCDLFIPTEPLDMQQFQQDLAADSWVNEPNPNPDNWMQ